MYLVKSIPDIINYLKNRLHETDITLYVGATDRELHEFENKAGVKLPDDIRQFYRFSNGFISDEDAFRIVPLDELIYDYPKGNKLYIAEYLIYCDNWELVINPSGNNDYEIRYIDRNSEDMVLTSCFAEFLLRFLIGGVFEKDGLYGWANAIAAKGKEQL